jgi:molybdenum cofactor cytidylyltransferase
MGEMNLVQALRLPAAPCLALVGAGGKTTALFHLARQLTPPVIVTATTHLAAHQLYLADRHLVLRKPEDIYQLTKENYSGVTVLTGDEASPTRTKGLESNLLEVVRSFADERHIPLLIEADGSRQKPLKAPADHEPAIPHFVPHVLVVAGLSGVGKPLTTDWVHRPARFGAITGLAPGAEITPNALAQLLLHPQGGLKNVPPGARVGALLNQADSQELQDIAGELAQQNGLLPAYDSVVISALGGSEAQVFAAFEPVAGVLLAAGGARRYQAGASQLPKQLLTWAGATFVRHVANTALQAGLSPLVVVLGAYADRVRASLEGLPVECVLNPAWESGQSTSIRAGLEHLPSKSGAAVFLLADQPQIPPELVRQLVERHARGLPAIVAPVVAGRRANPVLFDRVTFPHLCQLTGDMGGRALFAEGSPFAPAWVSWPDPALLLDVDTPEDYQMLLGMQIPWKQ